MHAVQFSKSRFYIWLLYSLVLFLYSCGESNTKQNYQIARNIQWDEISFYGAEKNVLGFSDDLILEIAKMQKFQPKLMTFTRGSIMQALERKDVDAVLTAKQPTERNRKKYLFSEPYFIVGPVLLIRKESSFTALKDLSNREVAYERSYQWPLLLTESSFCILRPYDEVLKAVEDMVRGRVDAVIMDAIIANRLSNGLYHNSIKIAGPPLKPIGLYLAVKKGGREELIARFNKGLAKTKKEGLYSKMLLYWGLFDAEHVSYSH